MTIVLTSLFLGGLVLIFIDRVARLKNNIEYGKAIKELTYKEAFLIGVAQAFAVIPGVSRSAATIVGGLFLGMNMKAVVEYSFLLAVPTIVAATGYDLVKNIHSFSTDQATILIVGFIASFITAIFGIKLLKYIAERSTLKGFGTYRIVLVVLVIIYIFLFV
jgi:undecaprenyl-diphosphatase